MRCTQNLILGLILLSATSGYKTLEGRYRGEKYSPYNGNSFYRHSNSQYSPFRPRNSHSRARSNSQPRIFGTLIKQLSSVLHRRISGSKTEVAEGRSLVKNDRKAETGDLYYHFYPHNQHLFNLPECATQQVCNAVYVRLNFTQPLCACPALSDPCSASFLSNDERTIELRMGGSVSSAVTLVKTCEPIWSVRECRKPRDWALLALQNTRTGKAHYLVICKCPNSGSLDGPLNHDQPTYAQVPGIRVYGMMCNTNDRFRRDTRGEAEPEFPWWRVKKAIDDVTVIQDLMDDVTVNDVTGNQNLMDDVTGIQGH